MVGEKKHYQMRTRIRVIFMKERRMEKADMFGKRVMFIKDNS